MSDTKPCAHCGATIARGNRGKTDWRRLAYCSRTCIWADRKAKARAAAGDNTKPCANCGETMTRPAQSNSRWSRVRYCSDPCRNAQRGPRKVETAAGRCEVCSRANPSDRKARWPWCSGPCKARWLAEHPAAARPPRARSKVAEDADPPVRFRSELLPDGAPRKTWVDRTPGHVAVCCGHCQRRFPRRTIRLAERLLTLHRRTCGSGL